MITVIIPYYDNPSMLQKQQALWKIYSDVIKENVRFTVIDDGSAIPAESVWVDTGCDQRLYRMGVDVRWNQDACRNLGAHKADTYWLLMTDIDHIVPGLTLEKLLKVPQQSRAYRLSRLDAPSMKKIKPHPNTWFIARSLFKKIGGYDERFAGWYGTDGEFAGRVRARSGIHFLNYSVVRYGRSVIADASTTKYERKTAADRENIRRIKAERAAIKGWKPLNLTFPWERVK